MVWHCTERCPRWRWWPRQVVCWWCWCGGVLKARAVPRKPSCQVVGSASARPKAAPPTHRTSRRCGAAGCVEQGRRRRHRHHRNRHCHRHRHRRHRHRHRLHRHRHRHRRRHLHVARRSRQRSGAKSVGCARCCGQCVKQHTPSPRFGSRRRLARLAVPALAARREPEPHSYTAGVRAAAFERGRRISLALSQSPRCSRAVAVAARRVRPATPRTSDAWCTARL
jgi:hypothetical protein